MTYYAWPDADNFCFANSELGTTSELHSQRWIHVPIFSSFCFAVDGFRWFDTFMWFLRVKYSVGRCIWAPYSPRSPYSEIHKLRSL
jgi:hypothetical protein